MVETVLRAAMERLDAEAAAARAEANAVVSAAVQRSADLVLRFQSGRAAALRVEAPAATVIDLDRTSQVDPADEALGPEVSTNEEAQVYDLFWSEIPSDQPLRERLRRWAQRPPT